MYIDSLSLPTKPLVLIWLSISSLYSLQVYDLLFFIDIIMDYSYENV